MSKLDRDIKAVLEEIESKTKEVMPLCLDILLDDDLLDEEKKLKILHMIEDSAPKTYDEYINDLKLVFRQNGWKES